MKEDLSVDVITLELFVTGKCNMKCSYCHLNNTLTPQNMPKDIAFDAILYCLKTCNSNQKLDLHLTGGEPLLNYELIQEIALFSKKKDNIHLRITTNGSLLNQSVCKFLKEYNIFSSISIDGNKEMHEMHRQKMDYQLIINNLQNILDTKCLFEVGVCLHPENLHLVKKSIISLAEIGVQNFRIAPVYGKTVLWSQSSIERLLKCYLELAEYASSHNIQIAPFDYDGEHIGEKYTKQWGCSAGYKTLAVLPDGKIAPCSALAPYISQFPTIEQGTFPGGLTENNLLFCQKNQDEKSHSHCINCSAKNNCLGGCPAINLASTNIFFCPPQWYCELVKFFPTIWKKRWEGRSV